MDGLCPRERDRDPGFARDENDRTRSRNGALVANGYSRPTFLQNQNLFRVMVHVERKDVAGRLDRGHHGEILCISVPLIHLDRERNTCIPLRLAMIGGWGYWTAHTVFAVAFLQDEWLRGRRVLS